MKRIDRYTAIWRLVQKFGYKFDYREVNVNNQFDECRVGCPVHGFFELKYKNLILKDEPCAKCSIDKRKMKWDEFYEKACKIHRDENGDLKYEYFPTELVDGKQTELTFKCKKCEKEFKQKASVHLMGSGCQNCKKETISQKLKYTLEEYKSKCRKIYGYRYDLSELNYISATDYVTPICPIHGKFKIYATNFLKGNGCLKCKHIENSLKQMKSHEEYISEAEEVHGKGKYIYLTKYMGKLKPITFKCTKCGHTTTRQAQAHLRGAECSFCSCSSLERNTIKILEELKIEYSHLVKFKWLGRKSLDFYLPDLNLAIECQGTQHFKEKFIFKRKVIKEYSLKEAIERDIAKYNLCRANNVNLLYVFDDKIKLDNIFNNKELPIYNEENSIHLSDLKNILNKIKD